jgi:hypothetical protein
MGENAGEGVLPASPLFSRALPVNHPWRVMIW